MNAATVAEKSNSRANHDAVSLLTNDHTLLGELFTVLEHAQDRRQVNALAQLICQLLPVHMAIEGQVVYPAAHCTLDDAAIYEPEVKHTAALRVLSEYILHHFRDEETVVLPQLAKTDLDRNALGRKLAARRPHQLVSEGIAKGELLGAVTVNPRRHNASPKNANAKTAISLRHLVERLAAQREPGST